MLKEKVEELVRDRLETAPDTCDTAEGWQFLRGQISALRWIAALGESVQGEIDLLRDEEVEEGNDWYEAWEEG